jgi:hypothetical protein
MYRNRLRTGTGVGGVLEHCTMAVRPCRDHIQFSEHTSPCASFEFPHHISTPFATTKNKLTWTERDAASESSTDRLFIVICLRDR